MSDKLFDPKKLLKLNNPKRFEEVPPKVIWDKLNLKNPKVLIDIGAGTGYFTKEFMKLIQTGKIYACDISDIMLEWMKENTCKDFPDIIPTKLATSTLPFDDEVADLVYTINLHHEIDDHNSLLNEAFRILKSGCKIFIVDWKKIKTENGPPLNIRFKTEEVKEQLIEAGFKNIQISNDFTNYFLVIAEK